MNKLLIVCGPTATGKTDLALNLAREFGGELISADSRQIYRGLDIITAKNTEEGVQRVLPWNEEKVDYYWAIEGVPIYLLDVADPDEEFSVAHYRDLAKKAVGNIASRNKLPILVGGTGLYIQAVVDRMETLDVKPNKELREKYERKTADELFTTLTYLDLNLANSLNKSEQKNKRRLIRKIEIAQSGVGENETSRQDFDTLFIGLTAPKEVLQERISQRVDQWMKSGAEKEARKLLSDSNITDQAGSAIVLPAWKEYFAGKQTREYVGEYWKNKDWQYAKRQLTWFKKDRRVNWFDITKTRWEDDVAKAVRAWYN